MASRIEEHIIRLRDEMSGKLGVINKNVDKFRGNNAKAETSMNSMARTAVRAFAIIGGAAALVSIAKLTADVESLQTAIKFLSGGETEAAKNLRFLDGLAESLGFNILELTRGFKTLQGGLIGTGIDGQQMRDMFANLSVGLRVTGASAEDTEGALRALSQIASKGSVQAEELRGQLGERLSGAFDIASKAMGVTQKQMNKLLEQGMVPAADFLPRFAQEIRKTFEKGLPNAVKTAQAEFQRLGTMIVRAKLWIGKILVPQILKLIKKLRLLVKWVKENGKIIKTMAIVVGIAAIAIKSYAAIAAIAAFATSELTIKQLILNAVMAINPVMLVVAGIAALIAIIVIAIRHYDEFGAALLFLMGPIGTIINAIIILRRNWEMITEAFSSKGMLEGFKAIGRVLLDSVLMPVQQLLELLSKLPGLKDNASGKFLEKSSKQILEFRKKLGVEIVPPKTKKKKEKEEPGFKLPDLKDFGKFIPGGGTGKGGKNKLGAGLATVQSVAPKIFNINIEKQIETLTFMTQNLNESKEKIKDELRKILLETLNDVQLMGGG